jgi:hypothetical protein
VKSENPPETLSRADPSRVINKKPVNGTAFVLQSSPLEISQ